MVFSDDHYLAMNGHYVAQARQALFCFSFFFSQAFGMGIYVSMIDMSFWSLLGESLIV
jgi:hypothetical protein